MDYLIVLSLIALSAIISAAEIGFFSVNETRLRALAEAGGKASGLGVVNLRSNPQRLLSIIMIGDRLVDTGAASYRHDYCAAALRIGGAGHRHRRADVRAADFRRHRPENACG